MAVKTFDLPDARASATTTEQGYPFMALSTLIGARLRGVVV